MLSIREAFPADREGIRALLPRLAAFEIPARRNPEDLWRGDERVLLAWLDGGVPEGFAHVAVEQGQILGIVFARLRTELLSGEPSAHLEVLAVADSAEGRGIATALVAASEQAADSRGATTMTLHVFASNTRARGLYEKLGYDGELIRFIKDLVPPPRRGGG